jgi:hypothetical protein
MVHNFIKAAALFILLSNVALQVQAQEIMTKREHEERHDDNHKFEPRVGLKGGFNFSDLYTSDSKKDRMLVGFHAGVYAKLPISRYVSIQPELYYTTKGAEVTYNNAFVEGVARYHFNYIELPILLSVNLTENFNLQFGPYIAYLVNGKTTNESSNSNSFDFEKNLNADDYNRFDAGITLGGGIDLGPLGLGVRYCYGLTTVGKERTYLGQSYTFPDSKNGVIAFYLSVALN